MRSARAPNSGEEKPQTRFWTAMASATSCTPLSSALDSGMTNSPNTCLMPKVTVTSAALATRTRNQMSGLPVSREDAPFDGASCEEIVMVRMLLCCSDGRTRHRHLTRRRIPQAGSLAARPGKTKRFLALVSESPSPFTAARARPGISCGSPAGLFRQQPDGIHLQATT